jgi:FkbM family methyltransferase
MKTLVFVGCNIGKDVTQAVGNHDVCLLIEPIPEVASELRRVFSSDDYAGKSISVIQAACSDYTGKACFNLYNFNGVSSSLGAVTEQAIGEYSNYDLSLIDSLEVAVVKLCDVIPLRVTTLIIDAQGCDLAVLKTIQPWLSAGRIDTVTAECDGPGFQHYSGLPENSQESMLSYMSQFPYVGSLLPGRRASNPDIKWTKTN